MERFEIYELELELVDFGIICQHHVYIANNLEPFIPKKTHNFTGKVTKWAHDEPCV